MVVFIVCVGVGVGVDVVMLVEDELVELVVEFDWKVELDEPWLEKSELKSGVFPKSWLEGLPQSPFVLFEMPKSLKPLSVPNELFWWSLIVLLTAPAPVVEDGIVVVIIVVVVVTVVVVVVWFPVDVVSMFVMLTMVVFAIGGATIAGAGVVGAVPGKHAPIEGS